MSKFDPPAPRFDPPTLSPPPAHQHNVQMNLETEIPPPTHHNHPQIPAEKHTDLYAPPPSPPPRVQRCNKAKTIKVVALSLRGSSVLFSFLSFVILATIGGFTKVDHYNYEFAVAMISFIYNAFQTGKGVYAVISQKELISNERVSTLIDFIGDQVIAYMLISAASVGFVLAIIEKQTAELLVGYDIIAEKAAAGSSMLFFAFLTIVFPALFSGYKLCNAPTCSNANTPKA